MDSDAQSQINTDLLIILVEKYPELYDKSHTNYKNVKRKEAIWNKISNEMNVKDTTDVKKKWTYLRDKFQREMKKINQTSGSQGKPLPTWSHFDSLMFLKNCVRCSVTEGNYSNTSTPAKTPLLDDDSAKDFDDLIEVDYGEENDSSGNYFCSTSNYSTTTTNSSTNKRSKRKSDDHEISDILCLIKRKCETESAENHIDYFAKFVKFYIKELPKNGQDEAIGFITNYLVEKNKEFSNK